MADSHWLECRIDMEKEYIERNSFLPEAAFSSGYDIDFPARPDALEEPLIPSMNTYIPGKVFFPMDVTSALNKVEQAICLKVLLNKQSGINEPRITQEQRSLFELLQTKINQEHVEFLKYVENDWKECRVVPIKDFIRVYCHTMWKQRLLQVLRYSKLYMRLSAPISLTYTESEMPVKVWQVENLLRVGTITGFCRPGLIVKEVPKIAFLPVLGKPYTYDSRLSVSQDRNVDELIKSHKVDIVISTSSLKRLMDDGDLAVEWDVPIVVKNHKVIGRDGVLIEKQIVYVDKKFPKRYPNQVDYNEQCHKRLLKANYCRLPQVSYQKTETARLNPNYTKDVTDVSKDEALEQQEDYEPLYLQRGRLRRLKNDKVAEAYFELFPEAKPTYHNASYDIWKIKPADDEQNHLMKRREVAGREITVLVRCKIDACEPLVKPKNEVQPLVIVPNLEYQVEYGARIATKSELVRQWASLFFTPLSYMYRVRMQNNTSEIVSIEKVSMQQINNEANRYYAYKPHLRLGILHRIFSGLIGLGPGDYLLRHTSKEGPFVSIFKAHDGNPKVTTESFDLHTAYSPEQCKLTVVKGIPWYPINVWYPLPVHITYKRMPGMFKPFIQKTNLETTKKLKNRAKKHRKACKIVAKVKKPKTVACADAI